MAEADLYTWAAAHLGLVSRDALERAGLGRRWLKTALTRGLLVAVFPGVWRLAAVPQSIEQRWLADRLSAGDGAVSSHRSAAGLWGIDRLAFDGVEVSVPVSRQPRDSRFLVHRTATLAAHHVTRLGPHVVTTPSRTLLDLGGAAKPFVVRWALEQWSTRQIISPGRLRALLDEVGRSGLRGAGVLRTLLAERALGEEGAENRADVTMATLLRAAQLPIVFHHEVWHEGILVAALDFAFPDQRVYIEVDGYVAHSSRRAVQRDRERQNRLSELGWAPLRFTERDLGQRPRHAVETVARTLEATRARPHPDGPSGATVVVLGGGR